MQITTQKKHCSLFAQYLKAKQRAAVSEKSNLPITHQWRLQKQEDEIQEKYASDQLQFGIRATIISF